MKIYLASSWKNSQYLKQLAFAMRSWGHEVDCFCDESTGRYVFHWSQFVDTEEELMNYDAIDFLDDHRTQKAFKEDKANINWADAVVMYLPCGRSAHLEAGYAKGQGKKLYIIGEFVKGEFDVMYGFADGLYRSLDELQLALKEK